MPVTKLFHSTKAKDVSKPMKEGSGDKDKSGKNNESSGSSSRTGATGMGNGASTLSHHPQTITIDNEVFDILKLKEILTNLRVENKTKENRISELQKSLDEAQSSIKTKDVKIIELNREVDKLRSVLDQKSPIDIAAQINSDNTGPSTGQDASARAKKQGVSGESGTDSVVELKPHDKDFRSKQLIKDAINENDFLKHLESGQVKEIVECMYKKIVKTGAYIIREGDIGEHLYVLAEGSLEVSKDKKILGKMESGRSFGELALLYNCNRTASVKALTDCNLWTLDRRVFQTIMMKTNLQIQEENIKFLLSVNVLKDLPRDKLNKIADSLERDYYVPDQYIVREGEIGRTFFIIRNGSVKVKQMVEGCNVPQEIRTLNKGDFFGERALLSDDIRTADVIAMQPGVEVLVLDRQNFINLIGDLNQLKERDYGDEKRGAKSLLRKSQLKEEDSPAKVISSTTTNANAEIQPASPENAFSKIALSDLEVVATLGMGGFGRVELVSYCNDKSVSFALKCMKKQHIVQTRQQEHVKAEKQLLSEIKCPFVIRLFNTYRDTRYVYMLLEACLGGELWTLLRDRVHFDDNITRFCTAGVIEALEYLHGRGIIYRDLKPENMLLDSAGYVKMCDFGFAKRIGLGKKTWTFCGTPEYVAPEVILNKGHDFATDYWSLGIFMYELLTGTPPFSGSDPMKVYNIILKGLDIIEFPKHVSKNAIALIKKLCRENPSERLGYGKGGIQDIRSNKYFQGFDWEGLRSRKLLPPIRPVIKSSTDTSNFDKYPRDLSVPPEENSGWDTDF